MLDESRMDECSEDQRVDERADKRVDQRLDKLVDKRAAEQDKGALSL